ncbi:MAG: ferrochelatase [Minwuia sp.]|uniref:ferrochelatase n=1 Tax=Minwuia sp. TaxID=2493630 RepID=UPI003A888A25
MKLDTTHMPEGHPKINHGRIGVMLVNLGTPDSTSVGDVRRYLREFLGDPRVIEVPRAVWFLILNLIILVFRPPKTARAYEKVWNKETGEGPLREYTRKMTEAAAARFAADDRIVLDWSMRYGNPSIRSVLERLMAAGCDRVLVMPLYPQYSATTTATVIDKVADAMRQMRWQPALRTVPPYYGDPAYIEALAKSVEADLAANGRPDVVISSFHGLPQDYFEKGDPYHCHCAKTARLMRERLGLGEHEFRMTFQSRFGPREWLQPYTDETLESLPEDGMKSVAVVTPGFPADCVETLEEIAIEGRKSFEEAGGEKFRTIPCLNDQNIHIDMLETIIRRELGGWL